jgi:DNA-binding response OmpR family regulator
VALAGLHIFPAANPWPGNEFHLTGAAMNSGPIGSVWRFGHVEFDEAKGTLLVAGQAVELDRNGRAILSALLRAAGAEVGKERLLEAGWPDRIVHENSLAKAIGRLRQALGEQGERLETIYGVGYRLDVELKPDEPSAMAAPVWDGEERRRGFRRHPKAWLAGGALLALAALIGWAVLHRPTGDAEVPFRSAPPLTGDAPDAIGRLLWVDDHPQNNLYEERFFEDHRIAVHAVTGSVDALRLLAMYDYDVVISDMGRGEDRLAGVRLVEQMRARDDETPFIIYTLRPDGAEAQRAQRNLVAEAGAQGVVVTPQEVREVILKLFGDPPPRSEG